ncbi:MAG: SDR family oxidoreductase [Geothrix sp.]|uniref:SDR family oxidoreductase n=1 Tax=Geothrix sp. TaxID=1962974 RepID=UPI0017AB6103|nr:SDR family oxidoreductase [Geothrix sp.]NWJ40640.1 SDR family oxidoreductase [Geothrix sp.]WIL21351.1 MAG: SDR family oxidoreductase [Geothrix sp.]
MPLKGQVALVTGASRGIGAAVAASLAARGAAVAVNYFGSEAAAQAVVQAIRAAGGTAQAVKADARDRAQVEAMAATVKAELGPIGILVLNASISFPMAAFQAYPWEAFQAKLLGELGAAFHGCQAVVPQMLERQKLDGRGGSIVAITSGLARNPGWGFCAHSAAKAGLEGFVRALACELGPMGIRVNAVAPGLTLTDATAGLPDKHKDAAAAHTPLRRNGLAEDVAEAVAGLVQTGFVTGATLPVNGGSYIF